MTEAADIKVLPSSVAAFTEALKGGRGSLDAWLEVNDEHEVAVHIEAYARANIERAVAPLQAEIERLQAEVEEWKDAARCASEQQDGLFREARALNERAERLAGALRLALDSHGVVLMTDPPQDAWKVRRVEEIGRALLRDQEEGHEQ